MSGWKALCAVSMIAMTSAACRGLNIDYYFFIDKGMIAFGIFDPTLIDEVELREVNQDYAGWRNNNNQNGCVYMDAGVNPTGLEGGMRTASRGTLCTR